MGSNESSCQELLSKGGATLFEKFQLFKTFTPSFKILPNLSRDITSSNQY